jgi:hypothetical protein
MASNSGLYNGTLSVNMAGMDFRTANVRARATPLPVTLTGTVGTPTSYATTHLGQCNYESFGAPRTLSTSAAVTISAGDMLTGIITLNPGAAVTATFDTAANFVSALNSISGGAVVGDQIRCLIANGNGTNAITLAAGTGGGFDTNQANRTIVVSTSNTVIVRLTNVTGGSEAYTIYF